MKIKKLVFSPIEVNTYIIDDENGNCAIIDCGCYSDGEFLELKGFLLENKLKPTLLLNTHMHLDHIFGNASVFSEYGLLTHASAEEESNRISATSHAMMFGMTMAEPPQIGTFITKNQIIKFGDINIKALMVPGHTAGSIAYYFEDHDLLIAGDALFAGSIGRSDLPGGDHDTLINSIKNELLTLKGDTIVYPGHGNETTIAYEKENNPYLN
jgi:hydroxyacylglutathione hydrolase